jgi:hypothetical protein
VEPQSLQARRVKASRTRFSTRGRRPGTTINFRLHHPARVELVVIGPSPSCDVVGRKRVHGRPGKNSVRFTGRVHGRPLGPGRYAIDVVTIRGGTRKRIGRIAVEVVRPGRRLTRREQSAPVMLACSGPGTAFGGQALPAVRISGTAPPAFGVEGATAQSSAPKKASSDPGFLRPPRLAPFDEGSLNLSWVILGLAAGLALAIAVYVVRNLRDPGEPTGG